LAVIPASLNGKIFFVSFGMPFKYRERRNAYFKEYMRKRRAREKERTNQQNKGQPLERFVDLRNAEKNPRIIEIVAA
jgi:hypothetical protein